METVPHRQFLLLDLVAWQISPPPPSVSESQQCCSRNCCKNVAARQQPVPSGAVSLSISLQLKIDYFIVAIEIDSPDVALLWQVFLLTYFRRIPPDGPVTLTVGLTGLLNW